MAEHSVTAVLGPTNTGKTHLAVERMLAHASGMIGLPLRLLAREVFDRVCARLDASKVALITGEEKIVPADARYWICTVEAMPSEIEVDFLAVDEVQLASDFERGHIFTDRILHRRGRRETMLLGADTMRNLLGEVLPSVQFTHRPRLSKLSYAGQKKVSRLPRRAAVVGFSAETVYTLAELIRRQRGGAAVVLGALSPRTRNAQVELYQSGDVDYIVATDAIGMGLNMDVDHVAFAATRKFDGFQFRDLTAGELGQIAGRAGRHLNDGTFGVTGKAAPFDGEMIEQLENHQFPPVRVLQWRNRNLSLGSLDALIASLGQLPRRPGLTRAQPAADVEALEFLARDPDMRGRVTNRELVAKLWDVCQIPDYRNITGAEHAHLVQNVFGFLTGPGGTIPADWFARQLSYCDRDDGDIDALSARIAHVRTWTFVANRAEWIKDARHWQARTREIEDKLSDALHNRLSQRFIDRKTAVLMKRLRQKEEIMSVVEENGDVKVEGELVGRIAGLRFAPSEAAPAKPVKEAVDAAVAAELLARAQAIAAAPDPDFTLSAEGTVDWQDAAIASLAAGPAGLKPKISLSADDALTGPDRDAVAMRMEKFVQRHIAGVLEPLIAMSEAEDLTGTARGLAFRLVENYGVLPRAEVAEEVKSLDQDARATLRRFGVRFGAIHVFVPALLKPAATQLRVLLWRLQGEASGALEAGILPAIPGQGLTSVGHDPKVPEAFYQITGFKPCGGRAVRIDMLERLSDMIRSRVFWRPQFEGEARPNGSVEGGGFVVIPDMMSLVGCSGDDFEAILQALDFRSQSRPAAEVKVALEAPKPAGKPGTETPCTPADGEQVAAEQDPAASAAQTPAPEATEADGAAQDAETEPAGEEVVTVEVWWPNGTGPFKARSKARRPRPAGKKHNTGPKPAQRKQQKTNARRAGKRDIRPEDSPFAALGALRARLSEKS